MIQMKLKEAREKAGISQRQLAITANLPQPRVCRYESGKEIPTMPTLKKMADVLGCKWHELVEVE